jgi:hypothetical protein
MTRCPINERLPRRAHSSVIFVIMLLWVSLVLTVTSASGQDAMGTAARVRIVNPGVRVTLAGTLAPLPLREDAAFPVTAGDVLETDDGGRALIEFADAVELLLLPFSRLEVLSNQPGDADVLVLHMRLDGQSAQRVRPVPANPVELRITLGARGTVTSTDAWYAVWSDIDQASIVTVAEGAVIYQSAGSGIGLEPGNALYDSAAMTDVYPIEPPYNAARLIADLFGCDGVSAAEGEGLNVRAGADIGFRAIARLVDGTPLRILGVSADASRYRIQYLSGFGWVLAFGTDTDCQPPVFPDDFTERNLEIKFVEPIEYELLPPFFGTPRENFWFWRWPDD